MINYIKKIYITMSIILIIIFLICVKFYSNNVPLINKTYADPNLSKVTNNSSVLISDMLARLKKQNEFESMIISEIETGEFTLTDPLIVINPYGVSPLTAIIAFQTDKPMSISGFIKGKDELTNINFKIDKYTNQHFVPIYGLYPNMDNKIILTGTGYDGYHLSVDIILKTEPLPTEFSDDIIITSILNPDSYSLGFNFMNSGNRKAAFDANGDYRWYLTSPSLWVADYQYNGKLLITEGSYHKGDVLIYEQNLLGKIYNVYYSPYGSHHDIVATENNSFLMLGSSGSPESNVSTVEDLIIEIDSTDGKILSVMDLKKILPRMRISSFGYADPDWAHINSIDWIEKESKIIISSRHQSAVVKLSWPEGDIDWIVSSHDGWSPGFERFLLEPIGENFEWPSFQHDAQVLDDLDLNGDTIDISLFDNGNMRYIDKSIVSENYSRMVHYRVNESDRTIEQIWDYGKEHGYALFSNMRGSFDILDNGNRLALFDVSYSPVSSTHNPFPISSNVYEPKINFSENAIYVEVNEDKEVVWEALGSSSRNLGSFVDYRVQRLSLYDDFDADIHIGLPYKGFLPNSLKPQ